MPGDSVDHHLLTGVVARGGMAVVYEALDTRSGNRVALKVPYFRFESDITFHQRFCREERIGVRLDHPGVVKVFPVENKSRVYTVMELVEGASLEELLRAPEPLGTARVLDIARQVAEALVYLHEHGIVHRDLKPGNIVVLPDGRIKLIDFGLALDSTAMRITWTGLSAAFGTPDYVAPEQIRGRRGDARADVYALGVILFVMLSGRLPFALGDAEARMRAKIKADPPRLSTVVPAIDPALDALVWRALAREPDQRYASALDMLSDLREPSRALRPDAAPARLAERRRTPSARWLGLAIAATVAIVAVGSAVSQRDSSAHISGANPMRR